MARTTWTARLPFFVPRGFTLWYYLALISIFSLIAQNVLAADFEGFGDEPDEDPPSDSDQITAPPLIVTQSDFHTVTEPSDQAQPTDPNPKPSSPSGDIFEYWDEDEFEGLPAADEFQSSEASDPADHAAGPSLPDSGADERPSAPRSYAVEILSLTFLIAFSLNYFMGKRKNEKIALAWATQFATKDSIFEKNFSLLGTGDEGDTPLLLKEGKNVFKFYASGRRFCHALLATMELKNRHDLISRVWDFVVPCRDEITFQVYMNDDAMDQVVFAVARKKAAKVMHKEGKDLQRNANLVAVPPNRKWVSEELSVISESREVAGDMVTETVLDQIFGDKAFEKYGKGFVSLHFSDHHAGSARKMLLFKFFLPDANNMADMTRLMALVPYYIDLVGRYKLSQQARSKTEAARAKVAQEAYKELQLAKQEALQKKKVERRKMIEEAEAKLSAEAEAKLSAEAVRRKEEKERTRQMKKAVPKIKVSRGK